MQDRLIRFSKKYNFKILLALLQILERMDRRGRNRFWTMVFLESFSGLVESGAIVWIAVFVSMFTNVEGLTGNKYLSFVFRIFNINPDDNVLKALSFGAIVMFAMIVLKNISFSISYYLRGRYLAAFETNLKAEAMKRYLEKPYKWFLDKKESDLLQNIEWINRIRQVLLNVIVSSSHITIMLVLFSVLIIYNYSISVPVIFVLSLIGSVSYRYIKRRIEYNENKIRKNMSISNSSKHNIIYDYKNIKINSVSESFYIKFINPLKSNVNKEALVLFLQSSPMFVFEILGFGIISFITIFMPVFFSWTTAQTLQYISLIAVTAWRIIPAMNRFVSNQAKIRTFIPYVAPVFDSIYGTEDSESKSLALSENQDQDADYSEMKKISFRNVSFSYGGEAVQPVIKNLTLDIHKGDRIGIVGFSGSGKTTFIDLFSGILSPDEGHILFNDRLRVDTLGWRKKISYLPQAVRLFSGTLEENIVFGYSEKVDTERLPEVYKLSVLEEVANREKNGEDILLSSMGKNLSGGQAQRLGIARLFYRNTEVLIIDEGTASLDRMTEKSVLDNVFRVSQDKLTLMITHHFDNLNYCNKILAFTGNKKIIFGDKRDILPQIEDNPDFFYDDGDAVRSVFDKKGSRADILRLTNP